MPRAGRAAAGHFARSEGGILLDGDVVTGLIGGGFRAKSFVGRSCGLLQSGRRARQRSEGRDSAEASLTSVYPYVRYAARDQWSAWAILGYGQGEKVRLRGPGARPLATDIDMKLGALGHVVSCCRRSRPASTTLCSARTRSGCRCTSTAGRFCPKRTLRRYGFALPWKARANSRSLPVVCSGSQRSSPSATTEGMPRKATAWSWAAVSVTPTGTGTGASRSRP